MTTGLTDQWQMARVARGLEVVRQILDAIAALDKPIGSRLNVRFEPLLAEVSGKLRSSNGSDQGVGMSRADELVREAVEYLSAAAALTSGVGGPAYAVSLRWLDTLSEQLVLPQVGLVVPSSAEFLGTLSQVIRLRLPDDGIWSLPVAVHEYGHFVATHLDHRFTAKRMAQHEAVVEDRLRDAATQANDSTVFMRGHEMFADAFATWVAGPAFLAYCLACRFDPTDEPRDFHPNSRRRVDVCLRTLDIMADGENGDALEATVAQLRRQWSAMCAAAANAKPLPSNDGLEELSVELCQLVTEHPSLASVGYREHLAAGVATDRLMSGQSIAGSPAVVINAAWRARIRIDTEWRKEKITGAVRETRLNRLEQLATAALESDATR